jgi:hypothetical protein
MRCVEQMESAGLPMKGRPSAPGWFNITEIEPDPKSGQL